MKPTGFLSRSLLLLLAVPLTACAVGPDYHQPAAPQVALTPTPLPAQTRPAGGVAQVFAPGADIAGDWWRLYHSPELDSLLSAALAQNPGLRAAQATLLQAEETERAYAGTLLPSLSAGFKAERGQNSTNSVAGTGAATSTQPLPAYTLYNASLSVSYALDIWGGARRELESTAAQAQYQRYELEAAYLTLTSNIVTAAIQEASLRAQIDATNQVIADEQQQLGILQSQLSLGGVAQASVLQEQATLASSEATLPPLQASLAQARNQLADYAGVLPGNFHEADFTLAALHLPATLPVSVPSAIVAQRPDIQAAAAQLHEASANVGVADAQMLPQISLTADLGHEAISTGDLFMPQTLLWSLVAGVTQPLFEGGQLAAKRQAALAALRASGAQYQSTVIAAFQNVADALSALQYDALTLNAADTAAAAAAQSLALTQAQYRLGGQPLSAVLLAQINYQNAAITQVKASAARLADTAALYQALGGGWWHRNDAGASCCGVIP